MLYLNYLNNFHMLMDLTNVRIRTQRAQQTNKQNLNISGFSGSPLSSECKNNLRFGDFRGLGRLSNACEK